MLPLNHSGSVRTEITLAPARAYLRAWTGALTPRSKMPLDGDALLISAMSETSNGLCFKRGARGVKVGAPLRRYVASKSTRRCDGICFWASTAALRLA